MIGVDLTGRIEMFEGGFEIVVVHGQGACVQLSLQVTRMGKKGLIEARQSFFHIVFLEQERECVVVCEEGGVVHLDLQDSV